MSKLIFNVFKSIFYTRLHKESIIVQSLRATYLKRVTNCSDYVVQRICEIIRVRKQCNIISSIWWNFRQDNCVRVENGREYLR